MPRKPRSVPSDEPVIEKVYRPLLDVGAQLEIDTDVEQALQIASDAPQMIISYPLHWAFVEPERGRYCWDYSDRQGGGTFDANVRKIQSAGHRLFLHVKTTPVWARSASGSWCCDPKAEAYAAFADLAYFAAARYQPEALVIWNEPSIPLVKTEAGLYNGCWGNSYNAGQVYAKLVKVVHNRVKRVYPHVNIVAGEHINRSAAHPFWTGAQSMGIDQYCDAVSFHYYIWDNAISYDSVIHEAHFWAARTNRPLYITETAVMATEYTPALEAAKCAYLRKLLRELPAAVPQVKGIIWYPLCLHEWRNTSLIARSGDRTAYNILCQYIRTGKVV